MENSSSPKFGRRRHKVGFEGVSFKFEVVKSEDCDDETQYNNEPGLNLDRDRIMKQVHRFIQNLASDQDKSKPHVIRHEMPNFVEPFLDTVESMIATYEHREPCDKFGHNRNEDASFFEAVNSLSNIVKQVDKDTFDSSATSCLDRARSIQRRAILLCENELLAILDTSKRNSSNNNNNNNHTHNVIDSKTPKTPKQCVFKHETDESRTDIELPCFQPETIAIMNRVVTAMISAGYGAECCVAYGDHRLKALDVEFTKQVYENTNADELQKMDWESLQVEIDNWTRVVKYFAANLFPIERKLCDSVFEHHPLTAQRSFRDLTTSLTARLLKFPNALVSIKHYSEEKLFKFLDVHETLRDLISCIGDNKDVTSEISATQIQIGEAAVSIFCQLEDSVKNDNTKIPVANGAVHPLTRYTMNYLKYACEYKDTLEHIFQRQQHNETKGSIEARESNSYFAMNLMMVMDLLDDNIDSKSKLYRDPSLRYIFLMNNGRYISQKIKGSSDIYEMMGQSWWRKRTSNLRQYHKNYQRETWSKVLQCISHEGMQVNGKVPKALLKERFKNFNSMFDEIHKTQSTWMVSDEQLKSELRVSITAVVIPAYRSFLGKFKPHFDSDKKAAKYIKYQPEDIESLIDHLFEGNMGSMGRKKHILI